MRTFMSLHIIVDFIKRKIVQVAPVLGEDLFLLTVKNAYVVIHK